MRLQTTIQFSSSAPSTTYQVTNTNDSGAGSLRQAIIDANNHIGADFIEFSISILDPGYSTLYNSWIIKPTSILPSLTDNGTIIDGGTQTANQGDNNPFGPEIVLDGSSLGGSSHLISIQSNNNTISKLVISNSPGAGVNIITGASNNLVIDNFIGVSPTSMASWANETGVQITSGASQNTIQNNIISGNSHNGLVISGTNTQGNMLCLNLIGLDRAGTGASPNVWDGVYIANGAHQNWVGMGSCSNVISGNNLRGVFITGNGTDNNRIEFNLIGTDNTGHHSLNNVGNTNSGIRIEGGAQGTSISQNVISGNHDHGIYITGSGTNSHFIYYNTIGGSNLFTPSINMATCNHIEGTACSNCTVEVFSDYNSGGRAYHGKTTASAILPTFGYNGFIFGPNITITMIDGSFNTSEFSLPVDAGCEYIRLPLTFGKP